MTETSVKTQASESEEKEGVDLDRILIEEIGYGMHQLKEIALLGLTMFMVGMSTSSYLFTAARMKTRCLIPECEADDSLGLFPPWLSNAVPSHGDTFDSCHRFASLTSQNVTAGSCPVDLFDNSTIVKCTNYVYEHKNSAVYEFDLACDEWRWYFIGASQVIGISFSLPVAGIIADRWGRRISLYINCINFAWVNAALYWSNSYIVFITGLFIGKLFGGSIFTCCYILALENVKPRHRVHAVSIICTCYFLGTCVEGLIAWTEPNWRVLILIIYLPVLISITYFWTISESARWLLSKNRFEDARRILVNAARANGRELSENTLNSFSYQIKETAESDAVTPNIFFLVYKHKAIQLRCCILPIWWMTVYLVGNGLRVASVFISGNKYVSFITASVAAMCAFWAAVLTMNRTGRKLLLVGGFWASGVCMLGYIFVPDGYYAVSLTLYLLGKFCMTLSNEIIYVYTSELFPTAYRSRFVTCFSTFGRIGELLALMAPAAAAQVWEHLPFVLFAGMSFLSGLLTLLVPETLGCSLPETMEDAENLGKDQPSVLKQMKRLMTRKRCYVLK